jgi:hypothetical protein
MHHICNLEASDLVSDAFTALLRACAELLVRKALYSLCAQDLKIEDARNQTSQLGNFITKFAIGEYKYPLLAKPRIATDYIFTYNSTALFWVLAAFSASSSLTQYVRLLGRWISRYLHTGQHKHRINAHTDMHALNGIRTHNSSVSAGEECSCLTRHGDRDRLQGRTAVINYTIRSLIIVQGDTRYLKRASSIMWTNKFLYNRNKNIST